MQRTAADGMVHVAAGMLETVRDMLTQDADPMVVSNCMSVIQKVSAPLGIRVCISIQRHSEGRSW